MRGGLRLDGTNGEYQDLTATELRDSALVVYPCGGEANAGNILLKRARS